MLLPASRISAVRSLRYSFIRSYSLRKRPDYSLFRPKPARPNYRMSASNGPLVWVDCEMTGLNHQTDHIIEICCLITNDDLEVIDPNGYETVIHYPKEVMDSMSEWCVDHHGRSGLTNKVIESKNTLEQVESELLEYLKKHMQKNTGILAGNSIHQDRIFMIKEFPKVIDFLHYRQVDVSSIKEVGKRHNPSLMRQVPRKTEQHTARADILESIAELKWYRDNYFKGPSDIPNQNPPKVEPTKDEK